MLVFLCAKSIPILPHVQPEEQFLIGRIGPKEYGLYRCIVRYGYHDIHKGDMEFEEDLVCSITEFIRSERAGKVFDEAGNQVCKESENAKDSTGSPGSMEINLTTMKKKKVRFMLPATPKMDAAVKAELEQLFEARDAGMAFILTHSYVRAKSGSSFIKGVVINVGYDLLRNCRAPAYPLSIPYASTLQLAMVYHV